MLNGFSEPFFEDGGRRPRALWRLVVQYCAYRVLVPLVFNELVVALLLAGSGDGSGGLDVSVVADSPAIPLASSVAGLVGAVLTVWLAGRLLDRRPISAFGFHLGGG